MKYQNIREAELKNKVAQDYFFLHDCSRIIGDVDFCVSMYPKANSDNEQPPLLWAEAKKGDSDLYKSITQLILTIGKARTFDQNLPPAFLGAFDGEKIAFVPYSDIHDVFYLNDFNWNVRPSQYDTKEFKLIHDKVQSLIDDKALLFYFIQDDRELEAFIKQNFVQGQFGLNKVRVDKNNFITIYNKWLKLVKPSIRVNWEAAKKTGIIDGDYYLADLLSQDNQTLTEKLFVLLKRDHYELDRRIDEAEMFITKRNEFKDQQVAHKHFWNKYERPPKAEYWSYIVERRDLLVPQDIRERKGSFFTPQIWVELSQSYLAETLGENWQDEYHIWDCAAGTGNLLNGLVNKHHIWASTLDQQDVDVIKERIADMNRQALNGNGAHLAEEQVFQFDFLNDEFKPHSQGGKIPDRLYQIISDAKKRKKLLIYINPPYAEATSSKTVTGTGHNKAGVATQNKANLLFKDRIGNASNELATLFLAQIMDKMKGCSLGLFSKPKFIQGANFTKFKEFFKAKYLRGFVVPASTFDNVKGSFPIGFTIWQLDGSAKIDQIICDVYDKQANLNGQKTFYGELPLRINKWLSQLQPTKNGCIGLISNYPSDFQNQNKVFIQLKDTARSGAIKINAANLRAIAVYFAVRHCIEATWLNDRDQFLYPDKAWAEDETFKNDCLAFTLFHGQNRISCKEGTNHWIPFTPKQANPKGSFLSDFMANFMQAKLEDELEDEDLFEQADLPKKPLEFSAEAQAVFKTGLKLWQYYHRQPNSINDASLYDIRVHFQGRAEEGGRMNAHSANETYNLLMAELKAGLKVLGSKIEVKVYDYAFLKR